MTLLSRNHAALLLLAAVLLPGAGCNVGTVSQQLVGKWRGRPDTFQEKRSREIDQRVVAAPDGEAPARAADARAAASSVDQGAASPPGESSPTRVSTDLEAFDFEVLLEFRSDGGVVMTLDGGDPVKGAWRVVSSEAGQSIIEIVATRAEPNGQEGAEPEKRRYQLEMTPDGQAFTLREEGADRQYGWLYFERIE